MKTNIRPNEKRKFNTFDAEAFSFWPLWRFSQGELSKDIMYIQKVG